MKRAITGLAALISGLVALTLFGYLAMVAWAVLTQGLSRIGATSFNSGLNVVIYCFVIGCCGVLAASVCRRYLRKLLVR